MIIYVAETGLSMEAGEEMAAQGLLPARLASYADAQAGGRTLARVIDWASHDPTHRSLFLDSGAFGAYSRKITIDVSAYCAFVEAHKPLLAAYASLDVIGDWRASAINHDKILARGLDPVPTFHQGSPLSELDRLARSHRYIALGGMLISSARGLTATVARLQPILDACFAIIVRHWPVKVHLFGQTQPWVLERYPIYSCDSSSAGRGAGMGVVQSVRRDGSFVWVNWREEVARTLDGSIADTCCTTARRGRFRHNLRQLRRLNDHVDALWAQRGVTWS